MQKRMEHYATHIKTTEGKNCPLGYKMDGNVFSIAVEKANLNMPPLFAEAIATEEKSKQVFTKQLETVENMLNINIDSDLEPLRMSVQEMQELEHTIQDYTTQVQTILQQLQQLTIQLQGQAEPNIVPLKQNIQLQQQHDALSLKIGAQTQQLENSQKALAQLQEITSNSKETEAQYEQASRLYQLLSGGNPKKDSIAAIYTRNYVGRYINLC